MFPEVPAVQLFMLLNTHTHPRLPPKPMAAVTSSLKTATKLTRAGAFNPEVKEYCVGIWPIKNQFESVSL